MTIQLAPDARQRLDAHLDAVEASLTAAGHTREQRRGIVDDLEAQVLDMLAPRGDSPTLADVEAVLTKLDPPAAYGTPGKPPPLPVATTISTPPKPRFSRTAIWGFVCLLASLLPLVLMVPLAFFMATQVPSPVRFQPVVVNTRSTGPESQPATSASTPQAAGAPRTFIGILGPAACVLLFISPLALAATILGWLAFIQIRNSQGLLHGTPLALIDALFYPGVIALLFLLRLS